MAETVRMVNSDGEAYDIPKEMEAKAFADGLRKETSTLEKLVNIGTDTSLVSKVIDAVTGNEPQLGDITKKYGQQVLIGKDGDTYVMPADEAKGAIQNGLRLPDLADDRDRALVAKAEASIDPSNQGVRGMLKAANNSAQSQFAETATFGLLNPEKDLLTDEQRASFEQSKEMNPISSGIGSVLGFAGGIAADPFSVGSVATKAGSAAERAVMGEATSLGGKLAGGALKGAVEGGVMSAPAATRALLEGDPEKAGETLLAGVGIGTLFGGTGRLAGIAKKAIAEQAAEKVAPALSTMSEGAESRLARLRETEGMTAEQFVAHAEANPVSAGEEAVEGLVDGASKAIKGGIEGAAKTVGAATGGIIGSAAGVHGGIGGYTVGGLAGKLVGKAGAAIADRVLESQAAQTFMTRAIKGGADALLSIGPALNAGADAAGQAVKVGSLNALARLVGADEDTPKEKIFEKARDKIVELHTDLEHRANRVGTLTSAAPKGANAEAMSMAANRAIDYLYDQLPKQPERTTLFQTKQSWRPSDADFARYERKVQVVMNPFSIIDELKKGTLTQDHVNALDAVYPALAMEMRNAVLKEAMSPKAPVLSKAKRAKLEFLLKMPLDDSRSAVDFYQSRYGKAPTGGAVKGGQQALTGISAAEETRSQALATRK